ncbi:LPXTG cell wall anchor domain-containing protein [Kitasatospora sp. NPDC051984]|uniref:LPXTG cell wall anchor domain-containing protein n=1 Tax=Kitasatospora sp. NPDC051984 TaxID=3364059 RepID=UPI0037C8FA25
MGNSRITRPAALAAPVAAAAILALVSTPAQAADDLRLDVQSAVSIPAAPDSGDATAYQLSLNSRGTLTGSSPRDIVLTFDATGLAGIATFAPDTAWDAKCTTAGQVYTCTYRQYPTPQHPDFNSQFHPVLKALKGAPQGTAGHLKISQGWVDGQPNSVDVAVYAGGPKLELDAALDRDPANVGKPGSTVKQSLKVTNNGTLESGQLVVSAELGPGLSFKQKFANCSYGTPVDSSPPASRRSAAICTINTSVKPGQTVTIDPFEATVDADALYPDIEFDVLPRADVGLEYLRGAHRFTPASGSGPRLTAGGLPEDPAAKPGPPNLDRAHNRAIVQYRVDSHADLSSWAVWAPTDGGKKGTLKVTAHSNGPASVDYLRSGNTIAEFLVTLPSGVTVAGKLPDGCFVRDQHPNVVACNLPMWLASGEDKSFDLPLAVSDPAAGPTAAIALTTEQGGWENKVEPLPYDPDNTNNSITLALGSTATTAEPSPPSTGGGQSTPPAGGGSTGSASASAGGAAPATSGSASSSAGTGGGLASTGSEGTDTMLWLGAGAIVVGGGVLALTARRRRAGTHQ